MSKSQLKRLAKQQEQEKVNKQLADEEDEQPVQRKGPANRFAFFDDEDEGGNKNSDSEKEESGEEPSRVAETAKVTASAKKKNKKKNKKAVVEETEEEMLERVLKLNAEKAENTAESDDGKTIEELMKADPKLFDPSAELKKVLGKTFKENGSGAREPARNSRFKPVGRIVKSKVTWPPVKSIGLTMIFDVEEDNAKWFKFNHNTYYETLERMYWISEDMMKIDTVQEILHDNWYHLNSLIMLANVYRMQEDVTQAADSIERGIFYCERMFAPTFQPFNWNHRINYLDYENRAFYLLLHRHMLNAAKKRCFETALNTAKFIFGLDPMRDPLAILAQIDTIAIKARQYSWFLHVYEAAEVRNAKPLVIKRYKKMKNCLRYYVTDELWVLQSWKNLNLLPNMRYSRALAKYLSAKNDNDVIVASGMLATAIKTFPSVVTELLEEMQVHPDSLIMNHEHFSAFAANKETDGLKMLTKIYVKESADLWKVPETMNWLEIVSREVASDKSVDTVNEMAASREKRQKIFAGTSPNVHRLSTLLGYSTMESISDPVPPKNSRSRYARDDYQARRQAADDSFFSGLIHSLYPNFNPEENFTDFMNRNFQIVIERARNFVNTTDDAPIDIDLAIENVEEPREEEEEER